MTFKTPQAKDRINTIIKMLKAVPLDAHDLAELLPLSRRWVLEYIRHLHLRRRIFIYCWDKEITHREKRHAVPIYAAGRRPDAAKPGPDSEALRYKRAWQAIKADPERHMVNLARRRTRTRLNNLRPDRAASWLFGNTATVANYCQHL